MFGSTRIPRRQMQRDRADLANLSGEMRARFARQQRALELTAAELEDQRAAVRHMQVQLVRANRKGQLLQYQAERGKLFDVEEELEATTPQDGRPVMNDRQFQQHLEKIDRYYREDPATQEAVPRRFQRIPGGGEGGGRQTDQAARDRAIRHAQERGISYGEAKQELEGGASY